MKGYRSALILGLLLITGLRAYAQEPIASELIKSTDVLTLGDERFDGKTPVRWYPLAIPGGARISVRVASVDFTPRVVVVEPGTDARIIAGKNGTAGGSLSVAGNGGVRIGVTTLSDTSPLGQYTIKVSSLASAGRLSPGIKRSGALSYDDESMESGTKVDWWPLSVRAGDRLAVVVESEEFFPAIVGTLSSGVDLVSEPSPDGTAIVRFSAASDATFPLGVSSSSEGEEGTYQIAVFIPVSPTPLEIGKEVEGTLADNDDMLGGQPVDSYSIRGMKNDRIKIDLSSDAFDTYLVIQEAPGRIEENDDISDDNLNSATTYTFYDDGTLEVRVYAVDTAERGSYTLSVTTAAPPQSLQTGSTVNGRLAEGDELYEGGYADRYLLAGRAGESITIALRSDEFDTYLILFTTDGTPIENDDLSEDVSDSGIRYVFDADGRVEILVTGYYSDDIGAYELTVESDNGKLTPGAPVGDSSLPRNPGPVTESWETTST